MVCFMAVYPRAYGEQGKNRHRQRAGHGLSPCLRGTAALAYFCHVLNRFIPVLTGNSGQQCARHYESAVYPRAYGEQAHSTKPASPETGLSPCLRGTVSTN